MRALTGLGSPYRRTHARLHSRVRACNVYCTHALPHLTVTFRTMLQAQVERQTGDGRRRWQKSAPVAQRGEHAEASTLDHRHAHHVHTAR